jgi:ABC-type branched-subunit amino acid transport system ATPase component
VFTRLTVAENFRVGSCDVEAALALFPELEPCLCTRAGLLSGGQQQMLALARALSRSPRLLLADELSLGLAPLIVNRLLKAVRDAADDRGVGVLMVEQHVKKALDVADRVYVLRRGRVELSGRAVDLRGRLEELQALYLSSEVA